MEPSIFFFEQVHFAIPIVHKFVLQQFIVNQIPLASRVMVTVVVTGTRKVQPFGMAEFVTCDKNNIIPSISKQMKEKITIKSQKLELPILVI